MPMAPDFFAPDFGDPLEVDDAQSCSMAMALILMAN